MNIKTTLAVVALLVVASLAIIISSDGTDADANTWYVEEPEGNANVAVPGQDSGYGTADDPLQLNNDLWDRISDGDTLYVVGIFDNTLYIQKNVNVIGMEGSILMKGSSAGTYDSETWNGDTWKSNERGIITYRDLTITSQFSISGGNSYIFDNCVFNFDNVTSDGSGITNVYIYTVAELTFNDCIFDGGYNGDNQWITGLQVMQGNGRAQSITVEGCIFEGYLRGCDLQLTSTIVFRDNNFTLIDNHPTTDSIAIQVQDNLSRSDIRIENNVFYSESPSATFFSIHETSSYDEGNEPSVVIISNSIIGFDNGILYKQSDDGSYCHVHIDANYNFYSIDGVNGMSIPVADEDGNIVSGLVSCDVYYISSDMNSTNDDVVNPPIIWDDDDEYVPPIYVPSDTTSSEDDTVKVVACAAAAVVAALMAAFLILERKR